MGYCNDVNKTYKLFHEKYIDIFNKSYPIIKIKCKEIIYKPWLTGGLLNAVRKKNNLYKSCIKDGKESSEQKYKHYKNKLTYILRFAKKDYYQICLFEFRNNIKSTWKILNEITKRINKTNNSPSSEFLKGHKMITDYKEICNSFNDYFINVGPTLANDIKCNTDVDYKRCMEDPISKSIYLNPVTARG